MSSWMFAGFSQDVFRMLRWVLWILMIISNESMDFNDPKELVDPNYSSIPAIWWSPAIRWSIWSMDFDNPKVYGDTSITVGLVWMAAMMMITQQSSCHINFGIFLQRTCDQIIHLDQRSSAFWNKGRILVPSVFLFLQWGRRTLEEQFRIHSSKSKIWKKKNSASCFKT